MYVHREAILRGVVLMASQGSDSFTYARRKQCATLYYLVRVALPFFRIDRVGRSH